MPHTLDTLSDVEVWLDSFPTERIRQLPPLARLQKASSVLDCVPSRDQRRAIQEILSDWGVTQKVRGTKRSIADIKLDLEQKVLTEAVRLRALAQTGPHALSELREAFARQSSSN